MRVEGLQNFTDQGTYLLHNAARLFDFIHLRIEQTADNMLVSSFPQGMALKMGACDVLTFCNRDQCAYSSVPTPHVSEQLDTGLALFWGVGARVNTNVYYFWMWNRSRQLPRAKNMVKRAHV